MPEMLSPMTVEQMDKLCQIVGQFPVPRDALAVYIETSGFTAGSAVIVDHAVCNMHDTQIVLPDDIVSSGVLNWEGVLPGPLSSRLESDLARIQESQRQKPATGPRFPYTYDMLRSSSFHGYETMAPAVAAIAAALQQGRTVVGHGLLSFSWQFLAPFLPDGADPESYDQLLLDHAYDTANIEKIVFGEDDSLLPTRGESFGSWQRACSRIRSKVKWSLRSSMFRKYRLVEEDHPYMAAHMLQALSEIMQMWRTDYAARFGEVE